MGVTQFSRLLVVAGVCVPAYSVYTVRRKVVFGLKMSPEAGKNRLKRSGGREIMYEDWNFNSGNYLFTTDTK